MNTEEKFIKQLKNPFLFKLAMLKSLPMVWLAGIKINELDPAKCKVLIKYQYLTQNPFRSIYFACLAMAAELSTGVIALMKIQKSGKKISMLVTGVNAEFYKKATGKVYFECEQGKQMEECITKAINTNEGQTIEVTSNGIDENGVLIARFIFLWSFKVKSNN